MITASHTNCGFLICKIAFRNLGRHKAKTVLTICSVALTVFLFVTLESYNLGTVLDIKRYMLLYESGAARIYAKSYYADKKQEPLHEGIRDYERLVRDIEKAGFRASPRVRISGRIVGTGDPLPITLIAMDPVKEIAVLYNHKYLVKGDFVRSGRREIVLGRTLADDLEVDVGDSVVFIAPVSEKDSSGKVGRSDRRLAFTISGIVNTPNVSVNTAMGFTALDALRGERGFLPNGTVTEICLRDGRATEYDLVLDAEKPAVIESRLEGILPDSLTVVGWEDEAKDYLILADGLRMATFLTLPVFLVLGLLGIGNSMAIAIRQRSRETGTLRSLGVYDSEIRRMFLYESGLIGVFGAALGLALGLSLTAYLVYVGIDISPALEAGAESAAARKAYIIHSAWSPGSYAFISVLVPVFCALFSLLPSRGALKADIAKTLRTEFL